MHKTNLSKAVSHENIGNGKNKQGEIKYFILNKDVGAFTVILYKNFNPSMPGFISRYIKKYSTVFFLLR